MTLVCNESGQLQRLSGGHPEGGVPPNCWLEMREKLKSLGVAYKVQTSGDSLILRKLSKAQEIQSGCYGRHSPGISCHFSG